MLNKTIFILFFVSIFITCSDVTNNEHIEDNEKDELVVNDYVDLDWMIGEWIDSVKFKGKIVFVESWVKQSEQFYSGKKYSINNGDTLEPTMMTITKTDNQFYYSYTVDNNQVTFVQDSISSSFVSFRNTTNVFPDNLIYELENDTLMISFSGIKGGLEFGSSFKTIKKI